MDNTSNDEITVDTYPYAMRGLMWGLALSIPLHALCLTGLGVIYMLFR